MRVIAGVARGIHLKSIKGLQTRPITDSIKESLFNILTNVIPDSIMLDLYAGTGAIGIEALSRGAKYCTFVEIDREAVPVIKKNLETTKLKDKAQVLRCDVLEIIPYLEKDNLKINIVFAGPPYPLVEKSPYRDKLLILFDNLCSSNIVQTDGILILQHTKSDFRIPVEASNLDLYDVRIYGDTQLSFFKNKINELK